MAVESTGIGLGQVVALLGAAVVAVPIFKRLGLGSVLGYLAAGLVIGPFGLRLFSDAESTLHVAELGVVMLLFIIGLEMKPARLWSMRRDIFGLGVSQVLLSGALLTAVGLAAGLSPAAAFIAAMGFTLTSTAIVMQILEERGETTESHGRKIVAILLLEDLSIVPLLAILAFLAPGAESDSVPGWVMALTALAAIAGLVFAGRYVLTPLFSLIAATKAREVMTAAALLLVLGAALALEAGGLSMAMGAFVAGVVLSESSFRHQLEADIEPFRGLLLGLFFLSVGMSLDLSVIASDWALVLGAVLVLMSVKATAIYIVARVFKDSHFEALRRALLMAQGGEFAFVLYTAAGAAGLFDGRTLAILGAAVIISMALTPLAPIAIRRLLPKPKVSFDGIEVARGLSGTVLLVGFGRFGQIAAQFLVARGVELTVIDSNTDMIRNAARFGAKIYYGDGRRLDVLRASGAATAKAIIVAVDDPDAASHIVELVRQTYPLAKVFVRAFDRRHSITLAKQGVDYQVRETFESAMALGEAVLPALGFGTDEAAETAAEIRRRDSERLSLQIVEDSIQAGSDRMLRPGPVPTPLTPPKREATPLSAETAVLADTAADKPTEPVS